MTAPATARRGTRKRGPYAGQPAEVTHVVPRALAQELDLEPADLELLPESPHFHQSHPGPGDDKK